MLNHDDARTAATEVPPGSLRWDVDPIAYALLVSSRRRHHGTTGPLDDPMTADEAADAVPAASFCAEVGRRLLLAQFHFNDWVLRRVEKVAFEHERRISRRTTVELLVPDYAPVVVGEDGSPRWLVPLTVMRRRTLVNLDLRDEHGGSMSMLGLRFTQRLDESMLVAAALLGDNGPPTAEPGPLPPRLSKLISHAVSGTAAEVEQAKKDIARAKGEVAGRSEDPVLAPFLRDPVFSATLNRLWHNFTLYLTLPVSDGRHRLIRMSFDEHVQWGYQRGRLTPPRPERGELVSYKPLHRRGGWFAQVPSRLGLAATRVRFLVPGAESTTSYHFEFSAPQGLRIARARLLAGRPHRAEHEHDDRLVSVDGVDGAEESVGLHAVEVPTGSLCRAQVDLRIPARGWLATLTTVCTVTTVILGVTVHQVLEKWPPTSAAATAILASLLTVSGAAAGYLAQQGHGEVAARMLPGLRAAGLVAISMPLLTGLTVVLFREHLPFGTHREWLTGLWLVAAVASVAVWAALATTFVSERWPRVQSPWDMADSHPTPRPLLPAGLTGERDYSLLVKPLKFDTYAIGLYSAEGWHEVFTWDARAQHDAVTLLTGGQRFDPANLTGCTCALLQHEPTGVSPPTQRAPSPAASRECRP